ncbi:MAG: hypothetical protein ABGY72_01450 [bacterium]
MILLRKPKTLTWCAVLLLTGVAVVGVWLVAPQLDQAKFLSRASLGTAAVLVVGRKLMSLASPPERHTPQTRRRPNLIVPDGPTR